MTMIALKLLTQRLVSIVVTFLIITAVLYGIVMLAPVEDRAMIYWSSREPIMFLSEAEEEKIRAAIIERYGLDDPYLVQYTRWLSRLVQGQWGWSRATSGDVLTYLLARTPVTAELTFYAAVMFIPLGVLSGVLAGWKQDGRFDHSFRLSAFIATSIPPFIVGLVLLAIFYVGLRWFPIGRLSPAVGIAMRAPDFYQYTGLVTIDGLLNGRPDISLDAFRHLVLPVITLSLLHWATLGRITRAVMIDELGKDYIVAAQARGLTNHLILWRHTFRNALAPALTSTALSIASLVTGVYVVEVIFGLHGVSELLIRSRQFSSAGRMMLDAPAAMGFAVYSVLIVLVLLFVFDVLQIMVNPWTRKGKGAS